MSEPFEDLRQIRLEKLQKLKEKKIDPFAQVRLTERQTIQVAKGGSLGGTFLVAGRVRARRSHGGSTFLDLQDESGQIQLFFSQSDLDSSAYGEINLLDLGDFIQASGKLFKTKAGELTLKVEDWQLLTKSLRPLPSSFYGLKDVEERYRQRYVDLIINPQVKKNFEVRSQIVKFLRNYLEKDGFLEVETPVLQTQYGGATARPFVTHHQALDIDLFLRISDELYLKRLIVAGFEKIFELAKDFRNEGIDKQHNPEFTMLEFYWAYQNYEGLMEFTEGLISQAVKAAIGDFRVNFESSEINFAPPWPRLTFRQALLENGGPDVDQIKTEEGILGFIKEKKIDIDLEGLVGYAPLLDSLYKKLVRLKLAGPLFLTDRPCEMVPLAKRKKDEPTKAASFQLVVAGFELVNAYDELNDPLDQRQRWQEEKKLAGRGLVEYQTLDEDYLRALEYGMPPTAGWGLGIDRLVSLMTDSHSLKDVILFPTLRPERLDLSVTDSTRPSDSVSVKLNLPLEPSGDYPSREKVLAIVQEKIKNQNLFRHLLAVEVAMKALARRLGGNEELWGVLGLIHDSDWEETKSAPDRHTRVTLERLAGEGFESGPVVQALKSHNRRYTQLGEIESIMEWALETCDELTGFIVSVALVRPDKKLSSVEVDSVMKKWKNKDFAAAVDRSQIAQCEEKLGIKLEDFVSLVLTAMKSIATEIGL